MVRILKKKKTTFQERIFRVKCMKTNEVEKIKGQLTQVAPDPAVPGE